MYNPGRAVMSPADPHPSPRHSSLRPLPPDRTKAEKQATVAPAGGGGEGGEGGEEGKEDQQDQYEQYKTSQKLET